MSEGLTINSGSDFIKVNVSNSKNDSVCLDLKFPKSLTVGELKKKFEIITGGNSATMKLEVFNGERLVIQLNNDSLILGCLPIENGMRIHVTDNFSWISEETVEKFELTDDQYETKGDTVRSFLKKNRLGKYNEDEMQQKEEARRKQAELETQRAELCTVGARCEVRVAGQPSRRGTVMYKGELDGKKGTFIGVKYDEPLGRNNGSVDGKSYFVCEPKYGGFVNPMAVEVGDFPPEDTELDEI